MSLVYEAQAPSNIALIKYWGKRDPKEQIPANDSLSMTLSSSFTRTRAQRAPKGRKDELLSKEGLIGPKALKHLEFLRDQGNFSDPLLITTENSFPSACGIASSASGFAALTIAALAAWTGAESLKELEDAGFSRARLAFLSRLGSGSACRSLFGGFVQWHAQTQRVERIFPETHWDLTDLILVVSAAEKAVSSSAGHTYAWTSPLFAPRLAGLPRKLEALKYALGVRDIETLGELLEEEALEMHAVMMSGSPAIHYFTPKTSEILAWIRTERALGRFRGWFTVDAGPNPHVLCETKDRAEIIDRLTEAFPGLGLIVDGVGAGPTLTTAREDSN